MAMIDLRDITKVYRMGRVEVHALRGLTLSIESGECVAVIGASGSGKSTLLNVIGCLDRPTSGEYRFNGSDVGRLSDDRLAEMRNREFGFVFQEFNLLSRMTAQANVELPLVYRGGGRRRQRALEALARVGLAERASHRPTELSGGEQQRVAIARALVNDPKVILADEPTGNLDSRSSAEIIAIFERLNREGITVVIVTHDMGVATQTRRIVRVKDGGLVSDEAH